MVLDEVSTAPPIGALGLSAGGHVCIAPFTASVDAVDGLLDALRSAGHEAEVLDTAALAHEVALVAREELADLTADVPQRFTWSGKSLKERFTFEGRLSLWWLNELSSKRSELYPAFSKVCLLLSIKRLVEEQGATTVALATRNREVAEVLRGYAAQAGVGFSHWNPSPGARPWAPPFWRMIAANLKWFTVTWVQHLVAVTVVRQPGLGAGERCAFYTHYPNLWRGQDRTQDEKYGATPRLLTDQHGMTPVYAATFASDGVHQAMGMRAYLRACLELRRTGLGSATPVHLMDRDLRLADFVRTLLLTPLLAWRYRAIERDPRFQAQWAVAGVNVFPLLRHEFRRGALRTPRYLLHLLRVRRFMRQVRPAAFVMTLFEFCYGRAMTFAAMSADTETQVIGVQHGPIARVKLPYYQRAREFDLTQPRDTALHGMPLPDLILVEGDGAQQCLVEGGFPEDRLRVLGAPRLAPLLAVPRAGERPPRVGGKTRVLVGLGMHDASVMLRSLILVLGATDAYHFLLKLHPRGSMTPERAATLLATAAEGSTWEVASGTFYDNLADADAVLATYSSVGMEAAALGYPMVCFLLPNIINTSPVLDVAESGIQIAADSVGLEAALASVREQPPGEAHLARYFFGPFDGQVDTRWAEAIARSVRHSVRSASA